MKRAIVTSAGLVSLPISLVMGRDYLVLQNQSTNRSRSVDEVLSTPLACSATRWYRLVRPFIFQIDPEIAHSGALIAGQFVGFIASGLVSVSNVFTSVVCGAANVLVGESRLMEAFSSGRKGRLVTTVNGITYRSPVGLSAGFDKNGRLIKFFASNKFLFASHCEIGSVSYYPWKGNPKPRLFRLPEDDAVINRMGLNNDGAEIVANRLSSISLPCNGVRIGLNITKTPDPAIEGDEAVADFVKSYNFVRFIDTVDWITLNISCPNTAEGKTFEDVGALTSLLSALQDRDKCIHLKVAPIGSDSWRSEAMKIFDIAKKFNVSALVIANTVPDRNFSSLKSSLEILRERGGLSGRPIFERSIPLISEAFRNDITVVGVGGVFSGSDAYRLIKSGASLVQLYTALVYEGPRVFRDIDNGLERLLILDGLTNIAQAVGKDV